MPRLFNQTNIGDEIDICNDCIQPDTPERVEYFGIWYEAIHDAGHGCGTCWECYDGRDLTCELCGKSLNHENACTG